MKTRLTQLKLTTVRLIVAVITMIAEQVAIWALWRFLLPRLNIRLSVGWLVAIMLAWLVIGVFLFIMGTRALTMKEVKGLSSMVGMEGEAAAMLDPDGPVKIGGEIWNARSISGPIQPGDNILVTGENGLKLLVNKTNQ